MWLLNKNKKVYYFLKKPIDISQKQWYNRIKIKVLQKSKQYRDFPKAEVNLSKEAKPMESTESSQQQAVSPTAVK